jgi:hypothetical protein
VDEVVQPRVAFARGEERARNFDNLIPRRSQPGCWQRPWHLILRYIYDVE